MRSLFIGGEWTKGAGKGVRATRQGAYQGGQQLGSHGSLRRHFVCYTITILVQAKGASADAP